MSGGALADRALAKWPGQPKPGLNRRVVVALGSALGLAAGIATAQVPGALTAGPSQPQWPLQPQPAGSEATLPEVSVRASDASRAPSASGTAPRNVTVITARDIARSSASSVSELLATEANLSLQSYSGNDRSATLDMRGMGETASSNVLIVVDGVVINENDLSGANLSSLSLSEVRQVEVDRGGGAIEHGSGAVAGVVRITTLPELDEGEQRGRAQVRVGTLGERIGDLQLATRIGAWTPVLQLRRGREPGWRDNGEFDSTRAALSLRWQDSIGGIKADAHARVTRQRDRYGSPGPVSREVFESGSERELRATRAPLDGGRTELDRQDLGASLDFGPIGQLTWASSHRERVNPFLIGVDASRPLADQEQRTTSERWDHRLSHRVGTEVAGLPQELTLGWSRMDGDYARRDLPASAPDHTRLQGEAAASAWTLATTLRPHRAVNVQAGLRWDRFESTRQSQKWSSNCAFAPFPVLVCSPYAYEDTQAPVAGDWFNRLGELGISWQPSEGTTLFVRRNGTFRAPNLDELNKAADTLRPQRGVTQELGWRQRAGDSLSWSATWFDMRLRDEIYYGRDGLGDELNRNRDEASRRQGIELSGRWLPAPGWRLNGMLSYLVPSLAGRTGDIPLVARTTAGLTLGWQPSPAWQSALSVRHVGPRRDGKATDADNPPLARLRAHQVVDAVLRYRQDDIELALGVNNLLDERYSTIAFGQTYYPMPGRQAHTTLSVRF